MGKVCDRYCSKCEWEAVVGGFKSCNYILRTGQKRPCDPGKGCTVRIINKTKRWKRPAWENRCVCCGEIIPEGRQVCPNCERRVENDK